ncbi:MAG: endonuclease/exonuclease/phosphatase family protein [Terrisporobacter sp.]
MKNKIYKTITYFIGFILIAIIGYVLFMIITDYKPEKEVSIEIQNNQNNLVENNESLSVTTFNTGYCGTDKDIDFFMDGGTQSRSISKERTIENLNGIIYEMKTLNSDVYFLQEVDKKATRSYKVNQFEDYQNSFKNYSSSFATNYKVPWVPLPITKPHGQVLAGLTTLSNIQLNSSTRYDLPGKESFFRQLGDLDRCILVNRASTSDGKELVLINVHLSAYDKGGTIRKQQLEFLKTVLKDEYEKGNYVVVGGDWNQQIPGTDYKNFETTQEKPDWLQDIPKDFAPKGFTWATDENMPTCRTMDIVYTKGVNLLSIIDGFLVSDNIDVTSVKSTNLEFKNTDHNPVTIEFKLK